MWSADGLASHGPVRECPDVGADLVEHRCHGADGDYPLRATLRGRREGGATSRICSSTAADRRLAAFGSSQGARLELLVIRDHPQKSGDAFSGLRL